MLKTSTLFRPWFAAALSAATGPERRSARAHVLRRGRCGCSSTKRLRGAALRGALRHRSAKLGPKRGPAAPTHPQAGRAAELTADRDPRGCLSISSRGCRLVGGILAAWRHPASTPQGGALRRPARRGGSSTVGGASARASPTALGSAWPWSLAWSTTRLWCSAHRAGRTSTTRPPSWPGALMQQGWGVHHAALLLVGQLQTRRPRVELQMWQQQPAWQRQWGQRSLLTTFTSTPVPIFYSKLGRMST